MDDDPRSEIARLESELEAARNAAIDHLYGGMAVWYGDGPEVGRADTPVDEAWFERQRELKDAADLARVAADQSWHAWLERMMLRYRTGEG